MIKGFRALFAGGLLGKLLGLIREVLLASLFGTSSPVAAFRVAQTATFVPLNFFTADTLSAGFLPLHSRLRDSNPRLAVALYKCTSYIVGALGLLMAVALILGGSLWVELLAPGYSSGLVKQTHLMVIVMSLGIPFYLSTVLASYLEISNGIYGIAALRSTGQSVGLILGTVAAFYLKEPIYLAWGFTGAYVVLAFWAYVRIRRAKLTAAGGRLDWRNARASASSLWYAIRPMLLVPILLQGSIAVERAVTTLVSSSAAASLDYARLITDTALILVAGPLGLTALASFPSEKHHVVRKKVTDIAALVLVVGIPLSSLIFILADEIVTILFARGAFDSAAVSVTSAFLSGLGIGLWAQVLSYFLAKVLSSRRRNKEAAIGLALGSLSMIIFDLVSYEALGPFGIGLGASVGALVQVSYCGMRLSVLRRCLPVLWPLGLGLVFSTAVALSIPPQSFWATIGMGVATIVFWFTYVGAIPATRSVGLQFARGIRR